MPILRTLVVVVILGSVAAADELRTLDTKTISGTVTSIDDKGVTLKTADGPVTTALENVLALDLRPVKGLAAGADWTEVRLVDDSVLQCKEISLKGKTVEVTLLGGQKLQLPQTHILAILRTAQDAALRKTFDQIVAGKSKRDTVIAAVKGSFNTLDGTLSDADDKGEKINFTTSDGDKMQLPLTRLSGMIFYRQYNETQQPVCMVYDVAGNALVANKVLSQGDKVVVMTTVPNVAVEFDTSRIAKFDYNMGKLTFLSDLVPTKVLEQSGSGLIVTHRKDVNLDGEPIVLDRSYAKGLSLHAHTELEFDLKGKYKKFSCVLGVDTRVGPDSQAKVTILIDGRTRFSDVITAKKIVPVDLDVSRANSIRFIVSSRDFLDLHDHVTIAIPKVTQ